MLLKSTGLKQEWIPEKKQMDKALKQRLVGASVLIILAVIVLPMLLSGRSDTLKQESRQIELPAKPDELSIETRRFPIGAANQPIPDQQVKSEPAENEVATAEVEPNTAISLQNDGANHASAPGANAADEGSKTPSESPDTDIATPPRVTSITLSSGRDRDVNSTQVSDEPENPPRYLVQVASFSSEQNANALAATLRGKNLPVLMDVVERTAGLLHRVRVGPYIERSEADAIVSSLKSEIKDLSPRVLDLRPGDSAPVSTPSDPLVRWVVQVGSFSQQESAEALVVKLRAAGLSAFSEKVSSASGTAYKVRIGPEINRDKATQLARQVKKEHGFDTFVTTME